MLDKIEYLQELEGRLHNLRILEGRLPEDLRGEMRPQRRALEDEILFLRVELREALQFDTVLA